MNALEMLIAQGIPAKMAERIIAQATAEPKEKKKKKGNFFPGMSTAKAKVEVEIDCLVICECCGATERTKRMIKALPDTSTVEMKLPVSICNSCPDYFRAMDHETLVRLCLIRHHTGLMHQSPRESSQVKLAQKMDAADIVNHRITTF